MPPPHIGRSFNGHPLEDACPCPQESCGLIDMEKADPDCPEHGFHKAKTLRQGHSADKCTATVEPKESTI